MKTHYSAAQVAKQVRVNRVLRSFSDRYRFSAHGQKHSRIYADYGYPYELDFWFFFKLYKRCGLAFAGVERPVDMSWLTFPKVKLDEDSEDEVFKRFARRVRLWPNLKLLDSMQRVGHYAGLVLTVADNKDPREPLTSAITLDDIVAVTPAWESQLKPTEFDENDKSRRYGLPVKYSYTASGNGNGIRSAARDVHYTRVIIAAEGASGNSIYGTSAIEPAFNACLDWEKIRGAGAEGFFKQAAMRGWLQAAMSGEGDVEEPTEEEVKALKEAFRDMSEDFDSLPYLGGMELKNFTASLANPQYFKDTALEDAAAGFKWSAKGLTGSQEGVLAGDQDSSLDKQVAQSRRENYLSFFIYDILDWLSEHCSDFTGERIVEWDDLMAPGDKQRLENVNLMQDANQKGAITGIIPFPDANELRDAGGWEALEGFDEPDFVDGEQ